MSYEGVCPTCGNEFRSRGPKKYCSMKCYFSDPATLQRLREQNRRKANKVESACLNCGKLHIDKASRKRKFCNLLCRSEYLEKRFDRHVASPVNFKTMQCFDEFVLLDELPCLVEGCTWVGQQLSIHMNMVHGVPAQDFKELVGFSTDTGVIAKPLREVLMARDHSVQIENLNKYRPPRRDTRGRRVSKEGKERCAKARKLRDAAGRVEKEFVCLHCAGIFTAQSSTRQYCSVKCRDTARKERIVQTLKCTGCGKDFGATYTQVWASNKGSPVCCCASCKGKLNASKRIILKESV